jgi:hypothetical protein
LHQGGVADVPGADDIGVLFKPARLAAEHGLTLAVGAFAMATLGTRLGGVRRVHKDHRDACQRGLVAEECPELSECPTAQPVACVSASSGSPLTNTTQVFQSDTASGALGGLYDLFAYPMILMLAKAGLFLAGPLIFFLAPLVPLR